MNKEDLTPQVMDNVRNNLRILRNANVIAQKDFRDIMKDIERRSNSRKPRKVTVEGPLKPVFQDFSDLEDWSDNPYEV